MTTSTPGPWLRGGGHDGRLGVVYMEEGVPVTVAWVRGEANARLIAAAPDMLEFVRRWRVIASREEDRKGWAYSFEEEARALLARTALAAARGAK